MAVRPSYNSTLDKALIQRIIDRSIRLLETKCIRLAGTDPNWRGLISQHVEALTSSESASEFERRFNTVLSGSGLSHIAFFHASGQRAPARYAINATFFDWNSSEGRRWVFQDVHEGGPSHAAGIRFGDILLNVNGMPVRPPEMPTFALGTDSLLKIETTTGQIREVRVILPKSEANGTVATPPMAEPASVITRTFGEGIGYLRVLFFPGANGMRFARELDRGLAALGESNKLIIDLRGNLGGFVGSLRLMSYLTPDRLPVGYSLTRKGEDKNWRPEQLACIDHLPSTTLGMLKMAARFKIFHRDRSIRLLTEGLGAKQFHQRIVMLVNEHTLSAGEMVAAFAAENVLARIVGTRTGGQVLGGANFSVGDGFILRFPAAAWYTWRGAIIEGSGVPPDVSVALAPEAFRRGIDNQLGVAVEIASAI
jgi:carboxyl-terminal processing protease